MKQRDNPHSDIVSEINSKADRIKGKVSGLRSKMPPLGFDKRAPKPIAVRSYALPQMLHTENFPRQTEVLGVAKHSPLLSEGMGGSMLNLNNIFDAPRRLSKADSHVHIERFLDSFRDTASAPLNRESIEPSRPVDNNARKTSASKMLDNNKNKIARLSGKKKRVIRDEDFQGITDEDYIEDDTTECDVEGEVEIPDEISVIDDTESLTGATVAPEVPGQAGGVVVIGGTGGVGGAASVDSSSGKSDLSGGVGGEIGGSPAKEVEEILELPDQDPLNGLRRRSIESSRDIEDETESLGSAIGHVTKRMSSIMIPAVPPVRRLSQGHLHDLIAEDSSLVHDIYGSNGSVRSKLSYGDGRCRSSGSKIHKSDASIVSLIGDDSVYAEAIEDLRLELDRTQFALSLEQRRGRPLKHVIGSQFRLPVGPMMKCEYCFNTDRHIKASRDSIRSLKLQLTRSEEEVRGLRRAKNQDISTNMVKMRDELLVNQLALQKQCDDYDREIGFLKKKIYNDEGAFELFRKQSAEAQASQRLADAKERQLFAETQNSEVLLALETVTVERDDLLKAVCQLKAGLQGYKVQLDQSELKRRAVRRKSLEKMAEDKVIEDDTARVKSALFGREIEVASLTMKIEYLTGDLTAATAKVTELTETAKRSAINTEEMKAVQRGLVKDMDIANTAAKESNAKLTDLQQKEFDARNLLGKENARNLLMEAELEASKGSLKTLQEELDNLKEKHKEELKHQMHALENAISNSVRLCVVAPTVNVHVTGDKFKLQSGLPENSIRDFIVYEVLSQYTFLFNQLEENSGPEGSDLQEWIQSMLYTMQDSIESHVQAAMHDAA